MASLTDLLNPTFLIFLGLLVLAIALLVVYFESKMREQNHKIASMLSLVSTLAEDMNHMKNGINHLSLSGGEPESYMVENLGINQIEPTRSLIQVSDDEESSDTDSEDVDSQLQLNEDYETVSETDEEFDSESESESVSTFKSDNENQNNETKIIKLQVSGEDNISLGEPDNLDFDVAEDLDNDEVHDFNNEYIEEILDLKYNQNDENKDINLEENLISSSSDLKTISINLGESHNIIEDSIDYKKLQLPKLRSIVVEKGLTTNTEASKLKKPELLKLLGSD